MDNTCQHFNDPGLTDEGYICQPTDPKACIACQKVVELGKKIQQMRGAIVEMEKERLQWKVRVNENHDGLTRHFPVEITGMIFKLCLPEDIKHLRLETVKSRYALSAPLVLSAVSRRWRDMSQAMPQLWTTVPLRLGPFNYRTLPSLAKAWIERSGQFPLSLNISSGEDIDQAQELIKVVSGYCSRWTYLKYDGESANLSDFSADAEGVLELQTLNLRTPASEPIGQFDLGQFILQPMRIVLVSIICINAVNVDWTHLTELVIVDLSVAECLEVLRRAPRLTQCRLGLTRHMSSAHYPLPQEPILHRNIQNLALLGAHCLPILLFLSCPALKFLGLDRLQEQGQVMNLVVRFIRMSRCRLASLSISNTHLRKDDITLIGKFLPTLQYLRMEMFNLPWLEGDLFSLLSEVSNINDEVKPKYLPSLRSMEIEQGAVFNWTLLPAIFCIPGSSQRHRKNLICVAIAISPNEDLNPDMAIPDDAKRQLLALKEQGVDLTIQVGKNQSDLI